MTTSRPSSDEPSQGTFSQKVQAIWDFTNALKEEFPEDRIIQLFARSLERKKNVQQAQGHVKAFETFLFANKDGIVQGNPTLFRYKKIIYVQAVYLDIHHILMTATEEVRKVVWQHLYALNVVFFPSHESKKLYQQKLDILSQFGDTQEGKFLEKTIDKIQNIVPMNGDQPVNPTAMLGTLFTSGAITDMMGGLQQGVQSGQLNVRGLLNMGQKLMKQLSDQLDEQPPATNALAASE